MTDERPRPSPVKTAKGKTQLKIPPSITRSSSAPLEVQPKIPAAAPALDAKHLPLMASLSLNNLPPTDRAARLSQDFSPTIPEDNEEDENQDDELALNPTGQPSLHDDKSQVPKKGLPRTKGLTYGQLKLALLGVQVPQQSPESGRNSNASNYTPSPILTSSTGWLRLTSTASNPQKPALSVNTGGFQVDPGTDQPITIINEEDDSLLPIVKRV